MRDVRVVRAISTVRVVRGVAIERIVGSIKDSQDEEGW